MLIGKIRGFMLKHKNPIPDNDLPRVLERSNTILYADMLYDNNQKHYLETNSA